MTMRGVVQGAWGLVLNMVIILFLFYLGVFFLFYGVEEGCRGCKKSRRERIRSLCHLCLCCPIRRTRDNDKYH